MPGLADLLGKGSVVEQIVTWQIIGGLIAPALHPYQRLIESEVNSVTQADPLSPPELARLVVRGYLTLEQAIGEAKKNGMSPGDFGHIVDATGNPIGPGEAAEALRRGIIPEDSGDPHEVSFLAAIRQGDTQNKWAPVIKALATQIPSAAVIIEGIVTGQLTQEDGRQKFVQVGGDPTWFDTMFHIAGGSPSPVELGVAANRGIISWDGAGPDSTSFHQGFLESRQRNKWEPVFREIANYHPPARTITALVREGSLTDELAIKLWKQAGLSDELAGVYLASAKHQKLAAHHALSLSLIEQLYTDKLITSADAHKMMGDLGYSTDEVDFILAVNDLKRVQRSIDRAANTIHTQYVNHKIDRQTAANDLLALGLASDAKDELLSIWDTERGAKVALLTPTQVKKALRNGIVDEPTATARLVAWGYDAADIVIFFQI